jgi:hypothetical protein
MRLPLIVLLTLTLNYGTAQRLNAIYRTTPGDNQPSHFLTFIDKVNCRLTFPAHGHVMITKRMDFDFNYKVSGDNVVFAGTTLDTTNQVVKRILNSRFILKSDKVMYDLVSGYPYVDERLIDDKHTIYSIDGKIFKQNSNHKAKGRLKRKLKQIGEDKDKYTFNILKGKAAYDKYGVIGMNGIIEIEQKK